MKSPRDSSLYDGPADDGIPPLRSKSTRSVLSREARIRDRALFIVLTVVQIIVSAVAAFTQLMSEMSFDACGERGPQSVCDYALADALGPIEMTSIASIAGLTIVGAVVRSLRRKRIWWLPLVAAGAAVAVSVVLILIVYKMINLSPFS
jgi:hypothetical protein